MKYARLKIDKLRGRFNEFLNLPFPNDSNDDELSDIHAELAEYDGFIAGHVSNIIAGAKILPTDLHHNKRLRERLRKLVASDRAEVKREAEAYLEYLEKLEQLVQAAKLVIG